MIVASGSCWSFTVLADAQIGQQFSTRVDVLSPEFVKELELLQVSSSLVALGTCKCQVLYLDLMPCCMTPVVSIWTCLRRTMCQLLIRARQWLLSKATLARRSPANFNRLTRSPLLQPAWARCAAAVRLQARSWRNTWALSS